MDNGFRKTGARNKQIDALRALALLLVLGHHFGNKVYGVSTWIPLWTQMGWSGVDLFFVLSWLPNFRASIQGIQGQWHPSNWSLLDATWPEDLPRILCCFTRFCSNC
jgi:hypothetical protein